MQVLNPLFTSFFTQWALAARLIEPAVKSADFLAMMIERNLPHMQGNPGRFYFNYDPVRDTLVTEPVPGEEINCFVDTVKAKQHFYYIGTAMAALADSYALTGEEHYLSAALRLAEFEQRLNPVGLRWPSYCKIGWGAAEFYSVTGSPAHRVMAANVSDITFMGAQTDYGGMGGYVLPYEGSRRVAVG